MLGILAAFTFFNGGGMTVVLYQNWLFVQSEAEWDFLGGCLGFCNREFFYKPFSVPDCLEIACQF